MRRRSVGIGALGIIGPGVAAALIEYALTRDSSGWIPVLASVAGGILVLVVMPIMRKRPVAAVEQSSQPSEPKIFSPRTPEELISEIEGRTEIVAKGNKQTAYW